MPPGNFAARTSTLHAAGSGSGTGGSGTRISFFMPAYNEEACVRQTAEELTQEFGKLGHPFELVVIDHASSDNTLREIRQLQNEQLARGGKSPITIIHLDRNIGYGGIINHALREYLKGDIIGWTCADGEVSAEDTAKVAGFLIKESGYAAAKAVRVNRNRGYRNFISRGYNSLVSAMFRVNTPDINGWPLFIRSEAYRSLGLSLTNWVINVEILYKLQLQGLKFKDLECVYQGRKGGRSKVRAVTIAEFFYQILVYRLQTLALTLAGYFRGHFSRKHFFGDRAVREQRAAARQAIPAAGKIPQNRK